MGYPQFVFFILLYKHKRIEGNRIYYVKITPNTVKRGYRLISPRDKAIYTFYVTALSRKSQTSHL